MHPTAFFLASIETLHVETTISHAAIGHALCLVFGICLLVAHGNLFAIQVRYFAVLGGAVEEVDGEETFFVAQLASEGDLLLHFCAGGGEKTAPC